MASGFCYCAPDSHIFTHLTQAHIHLFPITPGLNISEVQGCVSIPQRFQPFLPAMANKKYLKLWESELVKLQLKYKKSDWFLNFMKHQLETHKYKILVLKSACHSLLISSSQIVPAINATWPKSSKSPQSFFLMLCCYGGKKWYSCKRYAFGIGHPTLLSKRGII